MGKLTDSYEWARTNHKRPTDTILAFNREVEINEVILHGPYRFRITQELTREEFDLRLRKLRKYESYVSATAMTCGSRVDPKTVQDALEPTPDMQYFYAAEVL